MMGKTENRKKQYAERQMEEALFELLRKKKLEEISVTQLCSIAGVNRSTFYAHYQDIYDMMDRVAERFTDRLFREVTEGLGEPRPGYSGEEENPTFELVLHALDITLLYKEDCLLLVRAKAGLMDRILEEAVEWCGKRYVRFSGDHDFTCRAYYIMTIGGTIALWYDWMQSGFAAPKETLAREISDYITRNIAAAWNRT